MSVCVCGYFLEGSAHACSAPGGEPDSDSDISMGEPPQPFESQPLEHDIESCLDVHCLACCYAMKNAITIPIPCETCGTYHGDTLCPPASVFCKLCKSESSSVICQECQLKYLFCPCGRIASYSGVCRSHECFITVGDDDVDIIRHRCLTCNKVIFEGEGDKCYDNFCGTKICGECDNIKTFCECGFDHKPICHPLSTISKEDRSTIQQQISLAAFPVNRSGTRRRLVRVSGSRFSFIQRTRTHAYAVCIARLPSTYVGLAPSRRLRVTYKDDNAFNLKL